MPKKFLLMTLGGALVLSSGVPQAEAYSPWTHFDRTNGLVDNTVQVITRDRGAGLWIGTRGGVSHFDGTHWRSLTAADGLPDNDIHTLFVDPRGHLWVGSKAGFGLFSGGKWGRLGLPGTKQDTPVAVVADGEGNTWFGYAGGLLRFDAGEGTLAPVIEAQGREVSSLLVDGEGRLWVGTNGEVSVFDGTFWEEHGEGDGLPPGRVTALLEDSRGNIWCGTDQGLGFFDQVGWERIGPEDDLPDEEVTDLAEDREGNVWVATHSGTGYYDGYRWFWLTPADGLLDSEVRALEADVNGSIWIGTARGLSRYDTSWLKLTGAGEEGESPTAPLLRSRGGDIYLGAREGFIVRGARFTEEVGIREGLEGRVSVFLEDAEDTIWVGTDRGLYRYDGTVSEHHLPPPFHTEIVETEGGMIHKAVKARTFDRFEGLKDERVTSLAEDADGGIWVGTPVGLSRLLDGNWELLEEIPAVGRGSIRSLLVDGDGVLWAGTEEGLWRNEAGAWSAVSLPLGGEGREVTSLSTDREGVLWVGTGRGVNRRGEDGWRTFGVEDGLVGKRVDDIFQGSSGDLWFGTNAGVSRYNGRYWTSYSENDGLHENGVTDIAEVAGHLWFATAGGVSVRRPDRAPPDTAITTPPREVVASSSRLFEFSGSDLETSPEWLRYSYRLDDGPWSPFGPGTSATVTDMANGAHTFAVRCMDRDLNIDPTPAEAAFEVDTGLFDLELVEAHFADIYASLYQFYAADTRWEEHPAGRITVRSRYDRPLRVKAGLYLPGLMDFPTDRVFTIGPGEEMTVPLRIELNDAVLDLAETGARQAELTLQYTLNDELKESRSTHAVTILEKHSMTWEDPERIALYVTHLDPVVEHFAREVVRAFKDVERDTIVYDNLLRAMTLFDALGVYGVRYIADPENPYPGITTAPAVLDVIRLPRETLALKSGDCDDVAVLYAALLQNIGIDTAVVDVFDHVFIMIDTGLRGEEAVQVSRRADLVHVDGTGRLWIPVEVTLLGKTFSEAWEAGARTLREQRYEVIDVLGAWKRYLPLMPGGAGGAAPPPGREEVWPLLERDIQHQEEALMSREVRRLRERIAADPSDADALNALGVELARRGYLSQAAARFRRVIELAPGFPGGYSNLGNVLYERERFEEAVDAYRRSLDLDPGAAEVHVELALTYCETGRFDLARGHYLAAMRLDPSLSGGAGGKPPGENSSMTGERGKEER